LNMVIMTLGYDVLKMINDHDLMVKPKFH